MAETNYKVGDIVKIIKVDEDDSYELDFLEFIGNIIQINEINTSDEYPIKGKLIEGISETSSGSSMNCGWKDSELELCKDYVRNWENFMKAE